MKVTPQELREAAKSTPLWQHFLLAAAEEIERLQAVNSEREAFENGYHYATEGSYTDMNYQENVDQAYSEWLNARRIGEDANNEL